MMVLGNFTLGSIISAGSIIREDRVVVYTVYFKSSKPFCFHSKEVTDSAVDKYSGTTLLALCIRL